MAKSRELLHEKLCEILGSRHVYFQPPASLDLEYPCIVYSRHADKPAKADNINYLDYWQYDVTYIDPDPDPESSVVDRLKNELEYCSYNNFYISDNLNHDALTVYF